MMQKLRPHPKGSQVGVYLTPLLDGEVDVHIASPS